MDTGLITTEAVDAEVLVSFDEAKDHVRAIRSTGEALWELLLQAHEGRHWVVLGYPDWTSYVGAELDMSDRNARYLLAQGRVTRAIEKATGTAVPVSSRAAREIAPRLETLTDRIIRETDGLRGHEKIVAATRIIEEVRQPELVIAHVEDGPAKPETQKARRQRERAEQLEANRRSGEAQSLLNMPDALARGICALLSGLEDRHLLPDPALIAFAMTDGDDGEGNVPEFDLEYLVGWLRLVKKELPAARRRREAEWAEEDARLAFEEEVARVNAAAGAPQPPVLFVTSPS